MKCGHVDVTKVKVIADYRLHLTFNNGVSGEIDISKLVPFDGIFAPLKDKNYFSQVKVNSDIGTICWENGADLAPEWLYEHIQKKSTN